MAKVLLLSEVFPPQNGGSGRWLYEVYRRLSCLPAWRGTEPGSVVAVAGRHARAEEFDRGQELPIERPLEFPTWDFVRPRGLAVHWRAWRMVSQLVRRHGASELHCGRVVPEGWLAWIMQRTHRLSYVCYIHGEELSYAGRELRWKMRRVFAGARLIVANSRNTARLLSEDWGVAAEKLHVVHPGCDCGAFVPAGRDEQVRRRLSWSVPSDPRAAGRRVVLTVGRLQARKGHDMLIRALPAIRRRVPDVLYAIVGDGAERPRLEGLVDELGVRDCVVFHGEPPDEGLVECYQQCDLFALPNRTVDGDFEGFGMVLVEAQACGRAVLAGDSGGTRETMQVGRTGVIVDCTRPEPLADAVSELLLDEPRRERMGAAGRAWALSQFDWPRLSEQVGRIVGLVPGVDRLALRAVGSQVARREGVSHV